jgi:hypothetical protein
MLLFTIRTKITINEKGEGVGKNGVPINEIVNMVDSYAPSYVLEGVRGKFPKLAERLSAGVIAGAVGPLTVATAEAALEMMAWATPLCESGLNAAKARLKGARIVRLVGALAAAIGGGSALASLPASQPIVAGIGGAVSIVGSLATVFVDFFERIDAGQQTSLFEVYSKLVELRFESVQMESTLRLLLGAAPESRDEDALSKAVGEANRLCRDINVECGKLSITAVRSELQKLSSPGK